MGSVLDAAYEPAAVERYQALLRVSQRLISYRCPKELLSDLASDLREVVNFCYLGVGIYDEETHEVRLKMFDECGGSMEAPKLAPEETLTWWVYHQQKPLVIPSLDGETRFPAPIELLRNRGIRSVCALPLTTVHRRLGGLAVGSKAANAYSEEEVRFLTLVANHVALAVDDAFSNQGLRRSEAYLAEGQRLSHVGNWAWNLSSGEIFGSREFFRIIEFDPSKAKPTQEIFLALVHPEDRPAVEEQVKEMIAAKRDLELDFRVLLPSGSVKHIHEVCHAVLDESGDLVEYIGSFMDITERKMAEEALINARAELERKNRRLNLLLDVTNQVVSNLELRDLLRAISASVRHLMKCDGAGVLLPDPEGRQLRVYALDFPESRGLIKEEHLIPIDDSPLGAAFQTARPLVMNQSDLSKVDPHKSAVAKGEGIKSSCFIPLVSRKESVGVLALGRMGENPFSEDEVEFLTQVAGQVAIAVENARAYGQIADLKDKLAQEKLYLEDEIRSELNFEEIIGESSALRRVLGEVETVAPTDSTVLIYGETGTGKELIARAIHNLSTRQSSAFVKLNCAAIPTGLLESELFGHEKGAFTGAVTQRIGRFELAHRGTIFLDEIGEVPLELQPKLLRVLQEREFERLGSARTLETNARLIAATNRDLGSLVEEQKFRADLFYRLNVFPLHVPPLRERPEDIPLLVRHFAQQFSRRMNKGIDTIPSETLQALVRYHWPGNIRELQNVVERAVILSKGPALKVELSDLKQRLPDNRPEANSTLEEAERKHILAVLEETKWVVGGPNGAAARLGLNRSTLQFRMRKLSLVRPSR
ncbi:MAG TPA: sigma 54-interacting transcriptional regulator [Terriglobia bacterium]|nr:sigma 54-interacting transcriptional regulator [Terriglobia bacterium]